MFLRAIMQQVLHQTAESRLSEVRETQARAAARARVADDCAQPGDSPPPCDVAVLFALNMEAADWIERLEGVETTPCRAFTEHAGELGGRRIVVIETGVGGAAASRAAAEAIIIHRPSWVISAGFAGGLQDALRRRHVLMADSVCNLAGKRLDVGLKMSPETAAATKGLHVGGLLTVNKIIHTEAEKRALGQQHAALACDMETFAIAETCAAAKVRFLAVRVITDAVDDVLPPEVEKLLGQKTLAGKLGAAAGTILQRPSSAKDLWRLKEEAYKAADRLAKFLDGVLPQLVPPRT